MYRLMLVFLIGTLLLVACGGAATPSSPAAETTGELRQITMAMPFIPNIQFAAYYVADSKGYYADAGLDVAFDYNFENDIIQRVAQNDVEFAMGSGMTVLLARQQGLPITMVATINQEFPVVFFSKATSNIQSIQDLQGKRLGIPGRFGASYYALLALLYANNLQESDLDIQEIGFTQAQAVIEDQIDVAAGYAMNEPLLLEAQGESVDVIRVADFFPLASDGIVTNQELVENDPDLVQAFVSATMRGLRETIDDADSAFDLSLEYIPEAQLGDIEFQRTVLQASLPYWYNEQTTQHGLGYTDADLWKTTHTFMLDTELLNAPVEVADGFTNMFIK